MAVLIISLLSGWAKAAVLYEVVNLDTLVGATKGTVGTINQAGQIVGWAVPASGTLDHAMFWNNNAGPESDIGNVDGSYAYGINAVGQIVGLALTGSAGFWTNAASSPKVLTVPSGTATSLALKINDAGQIVGVASFPGYPNHAAYWTNNSSMAVDLGTLGVITNGSEANAINHGGEIVGYAYANKPNPQPEPHRAAYWASPGSAPSDLGTLGGPTATATAINDSGEIVGYADTTTNTSAAYWTSGSSSAIVLGAVDCTNTAALALNNLGQIVGFAYTSYRAGPSACIWMNHQQLAQDLNGLIPTNSGWVLNDATAINGLGEIGGAGLFNGQPHAFALIPIALNITPIGGEFSLSFPTAVGVKYRLQSCTNLIAPVWNTVVTNILGWGGVTNFAAGPTAVREQFYRLTIGN